MSQTCFTTAAQASSSSAISSRRRAASRRRSLVEETSVFEKVRHVDNKCLLNPDHNPLVFCIECVSHFCETCFPITHCSDIGLTHEIVNVSVKFKVPCLGGSNSRDVDPGDDLAIAKLWTNTRNQMTDIQIIEDAVNCIIVKLEAASVTYCNESAIDFIDIRQEIEDHFKDAPKETRELAMNKFEAFRQRVLKELEAEMKPFAEIKSKLNQWEAKNMEILFSRGRFDEDFSIIFQLAEQLKQLVITQPKFETKLFELKFKSEDVEIIETKVDFFLEIVFGPYFDEYKMTKRHFKYHSGSRFEYSRGVIVFREGEEFKKSSEFTFVGKRWYDLIEHFLVIFTMANNFANAEAEMIRCVLNEHIDLHAVIAVRIETLEPVDKILSTFAHDNSIQIGFC